MAEISVKITKYRDRKHWIMYYDDPMNGKRKTRSTEAEKKKDALKVAAVWEDQLRTGTYKASSNITWEEFRERYETEVLPALAPRTGDLIGSVFSHVERILNPQKLSGLTAERLSHLQRILREGDEDPRTKAKKPRSEATVKSYLAHLKAALKWAVDLGLLPAVPKMKMPKRAKGGKVMKGRAITAEEFDRMLAKIEPGLLAAAKRTANKGTGRHKVSDQAKADRLDRRMKAAKAAVPSWERLLTGLWLSGLRLAEAMELYWDDPLKLRVDLIGRRPMFRIRADLEKANRDRFLPMTPDFAAFLEAIPVEERSGPVFRPLAMDGRECRKADYVGKVISSIGHLAGVKVNTEDGKIKYASAHDLRRAFGTRWSTRVMPIVLKELMRHESVETTMRYYVGQNAEATADVVWKAAEAAGIEVVNTSVNSRVSEPLSPETKKAETLDG